MNNTINEIKNSLQGINRRITEAEEQISDLEDKMVEITAREQNKTKIITRDREGHYIMIKGSIQEDITIINI